MRYIDASWIHDLHDDPVRLVSEIDEGHLETRKLEFFRNGSVTFATSDSGTGNTKLGEIEVTSLDDINKEKEFNGVELSLDEFETLWSKYTSPNS